MLAGGVGGGDGGVVVSVFVSVASFLGLTGFTCGGPVKTI
ncbi:hypothetical protein P29A0810_141 [Synechococcus phage S-CAM8]|uniref:Uncharacterized protein n=1 Tax=Synechococcus phage S-CAM8 TaxID=754038 RepID=A0A1D8KNA4_9CAUD|nr:hypothetical protein P29A0810_141 [Synechococcus phage S-CAM8]